MLLSAALFAAGALSSMAQSSVYSLNVVGYVNIPVLPGLNLLSAPLQSSDSTSAIQSVLGNASPLLDGSDLVYVWNAVNNQNATGGTGFQQAVLAGGDGNWYDQGGNPATASEGAVPPGTSFFLYNGASPEVTNTLTIVGTVVQGTANYPVYAGINFLADPVAVQQDITTNGFPMQDNDNLYTWSVTPPPNENTSGYNQALIGISPASGGPLFVDQGGNPTPVALAPGAGFVYQNVNANTTWTRSFTVQ